MIQVLPIYPDTPDELLVDPKDVKEDVMRARGAGGQVSRLICPIAEDDSMSTEQNLLFV